VTNQLPEELCAAERGKRCHKKGTVEGRRDNDEGERKLPVWRLDGQQTLEYRIKSKKSTIFQSRLPTTEITSKNNNKKDGKGNTVIGEKYIIGRIAKKAEHTIKRKERKSSGREKDEKSSRRVQNCRLQVRK